MAGWSRSRWIAVGALALVVVLVGGAVLFAGALARPFVESALSDALQRRVTIGRLHLSLGRIVTARAENIVVANPEAFPSDVTPWLAHVPVAVAEVAAWDWLRGRGLAFPRIQLDQPEVEARGLEDGRANYLFTGAPPPGEAGEASSTSRIGALVIHDGRAHVAIAGLSADFTANVGTVEPQGEPARIEGEAKGTYAGQPIEARFSGGAVLALEDREHPWPLALELSNGPTRLSLNGTIQDPLALRGADLKLDLQGPSMEKLAPLSGVPFPSTPPYRLAGQLDYAAGRVRLMQAEGRIGRTDVSGGMILTVARARPDFAAELHSRRVDLRDLAGFIGAEPGRPGDAGQTPEQRRALAAQRANPMVLPREPISLPKLRAADVHVDYRADKIEGRNMPFDSIVTQFDIVDGVVDVKRLAFPIGGGDLSARINLAPTEGEALHAKAEIELRRVDFSRLMRAAGVGGSGHLGGIGRIEGTGRSIAEILEKGQGSLTTVMVGGTLSAFLVDLSGLRFARAVLSALGVPDREKLSCMVADVALARGALQLRTLLIDTESSIITGAGSAAVRSESLDLTVRTESKHFTVGSLPTPIHIGGRLGDPSVMPDVGELGARAGAAVGLGVLLPPLAVLPTIQFGVGDDNQCQSMLARAHRRG